MEPEFFAASSPGRIIELPVVLAIECSESFVARCRALGSQSRSKFLVRACDLSGAKKVRFRPVIIVVPRRIYDQKTKELDALANRSDAALLTC
jgi:hypothetical protein